MGSNNIKYLYVLEKVIMKFQRLYTSKSGKLEIGSPCYSVMIKGAVGTNLRYSERSKSKYMFILTRLELE